jgi:glycerol-3-phosphate dehydrogenase
VARLAPSFPFIESELRHAVRSEAACTAADVISRRTRLAFLDVNVALHALPRIIDVMANELKWSEARKEQEWKVTVQFMKSMGLDEDKLNVTREEVVNGQVKARRTLGAKEAPKEGRQIPLGREMEEAAAMRNAA